MALEILTSQSDKLLKMVVGCGCFVTIVSFFVLIGLMIKNLMGKVVIDWMSIIVIVFFVGGLIITTIGLVGVYVGNIFMQVKERPLYVVRTKLAKGLEDEENCKN